MKIPWYDSHWLEIYNRARVFLREVDPTKLAVFEEAFALLSPPAGFQTLRIDQLFDQAKLKKLRVIISDITEDDLENHELFKFGRLIKHNHTEITNLQLELVDMVSDLCGEEVIPSYNFLSLYNNLGVCEPHMDSPHAKWTLDVCIDQSDPWPIFISDPQDLPKVEHFGENWEQELQSNIIFHPHETEPGDALLFAGSHQWHYRDRIPQRRQQNYCHLIFFHFIPVACKALLDPRRWPEELEIPILHQLEEEFERYQEEVISDSMQSLFQP